jgi:hypothetical protein
METRKDMELTPQQQGVLASLAEQTGEPVSTLLDKMLDAFQERMRVTRVNGDQGSAPVEATPQPIWEVFAETEDIPEEEWAKLPTDLATQHDHYIYGTPKRPV